jgi:hypothetical protein
MSLRDILLLPIMGGEKKRRSGFANNGGRIIKEKMARRTKHKEDMFPPMLFLFNQRKSL